jgi:hypothetical protein
MTNAQPPFMGTEPTGAKNFKNVRIYHATWEKVIGQGKMYETFADVLDLILNEFVSMKAVREADELAAANDVEI